MADQPSGRERRIKAAKKAEFRDRQQYNRIKGRLDEEYNAMRNQGMTPDQIFAAQGGAQVTTPGTPGAGPQFSALTGPLAQAAANALGASPGDRTGETIDPAVLAGLRPPATKKGLIGSGSPMLGAPPAWWKSVASPEENPFSGVTGASGMNRGRPAWMNTVLQGASAAAGGLLGPEAAQGAATVARGTGNPNWIQGMRATSGGLLGTSGNAQINTSPAPDFPMLTPTNATSGPGSWFGNYYGGYKGYRRRRGGGGGYQGYGGYKGYGKGDRGSYSGPAWNRGLAAWNIG